MCICVTLEIECAYLLCCVCVYFVIWIFEKPLAIEPKKQSEVCAVSNCKSLNFIIRVQETRTPNT